jgi:hypothetical protein
MVKTTLTDIFADDDTLLMVKPSTRVSSSDDQRMIQKLQDINRFIDQHGRKPGETDKPTVAERSLKTQWEGVIQNVDKYPLLREHDRHNLLPANAITAPSLDDILNDDELLATPADGIFNLVHTRPVIARTDKISTRKVCEDFSVFKPLLDQCAQELNTGKRKAIPFCKEQDITMGDFFILNGLMAYVAGVSEKHIRNGKKNARLRLIFDNGMEGNNLLRSLATDLYKDPNGRRIVSTDPGPLFDQQPEEGDAQTGLIYVVKSLSNHPDIQALDGKLHKIGFTAQKLATRIQNAKDDPSFLMAPVRPVATYTLYNIDKVKLEHLLHDFFAEARLEIEITDRFGKKIKPREWFLVPQQTIAEAVKRFQDGSIIHYRYAPDAGKLVQRITEGIST